MNPDKKKQDKKPIEQNLNNDLQKHEQLKQTEYATIMTIHQM